MSRLGFLTADVALDEDGIHVWLHHDCVGGRESTMLPFPTWRVMEGRVEPSINCLKCGLHYREELATTHAF